MGAPQGSEDRFATSRERFEGLLSFLGDASAGALTHAELEAHLQSDGRDLLRRLYQDHLDLRAEREQRLGEVVGADGVARRYAEADHTPPLSTVFGQVTVNRLAYRHKGAANLHPADAALNLPEERYSHGLRRLAAIEATRGSFDDTVEAIDRHTGTHVPKRQVESLTALAALDVEEFYESPWIWRRLGFGKLPELGAVAHVSSWDGSDLRSNSNPGTARCCSSPEFSRAQELLDGHGLVAAAA